MQAGLSSRPLAQMPVKSGTGGTLSAGSAMPVSDSEEGIDRSGGSVAAVVASRAVFQVYT